MELTPAIRKRLLTAFNRNALVDPDKFLKICHDEGIVSDVDIVLAGAEMSQTAILIADQYELGEQTQTQNILAC